MRRWTVVGKTVVPRRRPWLGRRRLTALAVAVGVLGGVALTPLLVLPSARPANAAVAGPDAGSATPMTLTQKLDDFYIKGRAGPSVSVTVSQTTDLVRQRVNVSWTGARASNGATTYPVVIMQCWGAPSEVKPQNCWIGPGGTGLASPRKMDRATVVDDQDFASDFGPNGTDPSYTKAYYNPPGLWGNKRPNVQASTIPSYMPFVTRKGTWYAWGLTDQPSVDSQWPPAGRVKAEPPPDVSADASNYTMNPALTRADGTGSYPFEVLTDFELPSLGCTDTAACSLVVIPVGDPHCRAASRYPAGLSTAVMNQITTQCTGTATAMRDANTWKSPTNWERRFAFPLNFRQPPQVCKLDTRKETGLAGSQLMDAAMTSWRPKFCTDSSLFKLGYTALGDGDARRQFVANGVDRRDDGVNAVLTSRAIDGDTGRPVAYGPTAITAFTVAFVLDDKSGNEVTQLNFNARLLAKLITQSYPTFRGVSFKAPTAGNPLWWGVDPEFKALNPGVTLPDFPSADGSDFPVLVQGDLDVVYAITNYIAADPAAVAWLQGVPDEWNMVVNPKFRGLQPPVAQFELRDDWKLPSNVNPPAEAGAPWFNQTANLTSNLRDAAIATMQGWPTAQSFWDVNAIPKPVYKRVDKQPIGKRALLAFVDLPDARQFQLRTASLETTNGAFVQPTTTAMGYALNSMIMDAKTGVSAIDQRKLDARAYPGTMPVYTAVPTAGLTKNTAEHYAEFLEYAAVPGQHVGSTIGLLPAGYFPLTSEMSDYALKVAKAVRDQQGEVPTPPATVTNPPGGSNNGGNGTGAGSPAPNSSVPAGGASPYASATPNASKAPVLSSAATQTDTSGIARWALPLLLAIGLVAAVLAPVAAVAVRPDHPVRRFISRALPGLARRRTS
jgi:hypothetical protein